MSIFTSPIKSIPINKKEDEDIKPIYKTSSQIISDVAIIKDILAKRRPGISDQDKISQIYGPSILGTMDIWNNIMQSIMYDKDARRFVPNKTNYIKIIEELMVSLAIFLNDLTKSQSDLISDTKYILTYKNHNNTEQIIYPRLLYFISGVLRPLLNIQKFKKILLNYCPNIIDE